MPSTPALLEMTVRFFDAGVADRVDQGFGNAAQAEAARHDRHAVLENAVEGGFGVRIDLVHDATT